MGEGCQPVSTGLWTIIYFTIWFYFISPALIKCVSFQIVGWIRIVCGQLSAFQLLFLTFPVILWLKTLKINFFGHEPMLPWNGRIRLYVYIYGFAGSSTLVYFVTLQICLQCVTDHFVKAIWNNWTDHFRTESVRESK